MLQESHQKRYLSMSYGCAVFHHETPSKRNHNPEVAGSNPAPATKYFNALRVIAGRISLQLVPAKIARRSAATNPQFRIAVAGKTTKNR